MSSYSMGRAFVHTTAATHVLVEHIFLFPNQRRKLLHAPKTNFDRGAGVERESPSHMVSASGLALISQQAIHIQLTNIIPTSDPRRRFGPGLDFGKTTMATRKVADHTLYHLSPKGFWKKFRELGW